MSHIHVLTLLCGILGAATLPGQPRPDFSGVWRLLPGESRLIGAAGPLPESYQLTWLVDHRDPEITVGVNVRNETGTQEFTFRCTTDGRECVNELPALGEVRRITSVWEGDVLVMTQQATTPHGGFEAKDRLSLAGNGERLVFERVVTNAAGERHSKQVFRRLGPHPSRRQPPPLPTAELPAELSRVLRDYGRHWHGGNANAQVFPAMLPLDVGC